MTKGLGGIFRKFVVCFWGKLLFACSILFFKQTKPPGKTHHMTRAQAWPSLQGQSRRPADTREPRGPSLREKHRAGFPARAEQTPTVEGEVNTDIFQNSVTFKLVSEKLM